MPTVFILNKSGHDTSAAEKYGSIEYLTDGPVNRFKVNAIYRLCMDRFIHSSAEDILCITGHDALCATASACFGWIHGKVNLLVYDARTKDYILRTFVLDPDKLLPNERYKNHESNRAEN